MSDQLKNNEDELIRENVDEGVLESRREFLRRLGKWSAVIVGGAALSGILVPTDAAGWVNGGAAWVNARGGGGATWVNRVGGGGWINKVGGGGWLNGGAAWVNARGGWINRR